MRRRTPFSGPLLFRGCESGERQEIGRLVAIDWAGIEESSSSRAGSITVACREGRFDVSVTRPDGRELTRSIDLQQLPPRARPRIIAIAVVELFAASAVETPPSPSPAAVPAPDADFDLKRPTTTPCCRLHVEVAGSGRTFLRGLPRLLGGGLRGSTQHGLFGFDALVEVGAPSTTQGSVQVLSLTSGVTAGWSFALDTAMLRAGCGLRAGVAKLSGEPNDPVHWVGQSPWRGWGGPELQASVALHPSSSSVVEFTLESGYSLFSIYGLVADQREVDIRGVWIGAQLGVGIGL